MSKKLQYHGEMATATEIVRSLHSTLIPRNLKLGMQFPDSENVQCNLETVQISGLHGTYKCCTLVRPK